MSVAVRNLRALASERQLFGADNFMLNEFPAASRLVEGDVNFFSLDADAIQQLRLSLRKRRLSSPTFAQSSHRNA